jgi:DNA-directed RNA polymerase subunit M/transcription elongation factor TFIIS
MRSIGQIKRVEKTQQPFSVECKKCKKIMTPKIDKNDNLACVNCSTIYENISAPFENLIRQKIK